MLKSNSYIFMSYEGVNNNHSIEEQQVNQGVMFSQFPIARFYSEIPVAFETETQAIISTTVNRLPADLRDLGLAVFIHPTLDYDMYPELPIGGEAIFDYELPEIHA